MPFGPPVSVGAVSRMLSPLSPNLSEQEAKLAALVARLQARVQTYLRLRSDGAEQTDHLRHVAERARWIYLNEAQRLTPNSMPRLTQRESLLLDACALSHDIGKWIPREELRALLPKTSDSIITLLRELQFLPNQSDLFLLGIRRRLNLPRDGYSAEYDAAHHLVSAYLLIADPELEIHDLSLRDQEWLIMAVIGHQFGSYYKERLFQISLKDREITTGMLVDISRPELLRGDRLASAFHDADIADLLYVGSLDGRAENETVLRAGGLLKILLINLSTLVLEVPGSPRTFEECLRSCWSTVNNVGKEFLMQTAVENGYKWRKRATQFLNQLQEPGNAREFEVLLTDTTRPATERVALLRQLTYLRARQFLQTEAHSA